MPCLAKIKYRWLSPPGAPWHGIIPFPENCSLSHSLSKNAEIKILVPHIYINSEIIPGSKRTKVHNIPLFTRFITIQTDLSIAIQIFKPSIPDTNIRRYSAQSLIVIQFPLSSYDSV